MERPVHGREIIATTDRPTFLNTSRLDTTNAGRSVSLARCRSFFSTARLALKISYAMFPKPNFGAQHRCRPMAHRANGTNK